MRLFGRKVLKRYEEKTHQRRAETRDGILWDVLEDDRVCRIEIGLRRPLGSSREMPYE